MRTLRRALALGSASVVVLVAFACSDTTVVAGSSGAPPEADGAVITEDDAEAFEADGAVKPKPDTSPKPSKVNVTVESVAVLGNPREYALAVPKTYAAARKYPLIIALHGDGQNGPGFVKFLDFESVNGDDVIVAYPTGAEDLFATYAQNPDELLVEATINAVKAKLSIDDAKVWGFGYSKGGFMANEIACLKPGLFKAMAAHASGAAEEPRVNGYPDCPGVIGLPVLVTEGSFDTGIGGNYAAQYWASVNGCGTSRSDTTPAGCQKFNGCAAGTPTQYCLAAGVGHYPIWNQAAAISWAWFNTL